MFKLLTGLILIWLTIFTVRVNQIGGIDLDYRDEPVELLTELRISLTEGINEIVPYPQSALLAGMTLGAGENVPWKLKEALKSTTTIHLIVVSGQNLSILAGLVMGLSVYLGRRKTVILTISLILFYVVLTGGQVPVLRAAVMAFFSYLALMLGKEAVGWWVLILTAALMLIVNPNWIISISFQLSFLATAGVVVVGPMLTKIFKVVPNFLREDLAITLAAQALTLPVIAYNFERISLVGIFSNLMVVWTAPWIMLGGLATIFTMLVNPFLGQVISLFPSTLLTYFIYIVEFFSAIPFSAVDLPSTYIWMWVGYYLVLIAGVGYLSKIQK